MKFATALTLAALIACACAHPARVEPHQTGSAPGAAGERIGKYMDVPASAIGPAVDSAKGYRLQDLGSGLYMITDDVYQSMFLVYGKGVVVIDAPPSYAAHIRTSRHRGGRQDPRGESACATIAARPATRGV